MILTQELLSSLKESNSGWAFILLNLRGAFEHSLGVTLALAIPFLAPSPWIFSELLPAVQSLLIPQLVPTHVDIPRLIPTYGYLPLLLCLFGIFWLAIRGSRREYGLILGLLALLVMLAVFFTFHYGQLFVYERGLMVAMLMMSIVAGAGLMAIRKVKLPLRVINRLKMSPPWHNAGYVLGLITVILLLYTGIPARQSISYYHMIDDKDYQAFIWIKNNLEGNNEKAILDPWKATAFTAITGKKVYSRTHCYPDSNGQRTYEFLSNGSNDTAFLIENSISLVYTRGIVDNPDLVEVRSNVYLINEEVVSE